MSDDWPERIGIPVIEECRTKLDFVAKCLGGEKRQVEGRMIRLMEWREDDIFDPIEVK